jgi:hypothetical protein
MSRRPQGISGDLVFQEGKKLGEDAYIISVYDDPAKCRVTFAAYELETDEAYPLSKSYSQLDEIFQFNSDLVNPNNRDGRFHWIVKRLDFVLSELDGQKELTLAPEETPDDVETKAKPKAKEQMVGSIDAELRAKLLRELETYDTEGLQLELVKSEDARHRFLQELHAKRRIEQLKAQQRIIKVDEEREERLQQLREGRVLRDEKALRYKEEQEVRSQTIASLEKMMKQKGMAAVRKLREDKLAEEEAKETRIAQAKHKKMTGQMSLAKQREAATARFKETEDLRKQEIDKRKEEVFAVTMQICEARRRRMDEEIRVKKVLEEKRAEHLVHLEDQMERRRAGASKKTEDWAMIEDVRWKREVERDTFRTNQCRDRWEEDKQRCLTEQTRKRVAKEEAVRMYMEQHRAKCKRKAVRRRKLRELEQRREEKIQDRLEARLKRLKHEQWQEELRPKRNYGDTLLRLKKGELTNNEDTSAEAKQFKHAESRDGRMEIRGQQLAEKEKKVDKQLRACQKFRDMDEVEKLRAWKEAEHQRKANIEDKRLAREEEQEQAREKKRLGAQAFAETFERLEGVRNEKLKHAQDLRLARCLEKIQNCPQGMGVPLCA